MNDAAARLLKKLLKEREWSIEDLVRMTGIPRPTVSRHVNGKTFPKLEDRVKYALAFEMTSKDFEKTWQTANVSGLAAGTSSATGTLTGVLGVIPSNKPKAPPVPIDPNVEPHRELLLMPPTYDWAIAAGPWVDMPEDASDFTLDRRIVAQGRFRVRIRGDSMEPRWKDGCTIEFRRIAEGNDPIPYGEDCYFRTVDGRATFKRLERIDDLCYVLRALNTAKYPEPMRVPTQEIVYLAIAEHEIRVPPK